MGCKIARIEYFLPEDVLTTKRLAELSGRLNPDKIEKRVGVRERHVAREDQTSLDLAYESSTRVLGECDRNKIDFLILCTQSPAYYLPPAACILQDKLGLRTDIGALDINMGCSGFVYGLAMAKGFISIGIAKTVLVVVSETITKLIHEKDFSNKIILVIVRLLPLLKKMTVNLS